MSAFLWIESRGELPAPVIIENDKSRSAQGLEFIADSHAGNSIYFDAANPHC